MVLLTARMFERFGKLRLLPIADSYLIRNTFAKPPRMSRRIVRTNYLSLSPYPQSDIASVTIGNDLLVWFSPHHNAPVQIPEALLLYRALLSRGADDRIAVFKTAPETFIVIKEGLLVAQAPVSAADTPLFERLKRQYSLQRIERYGSDEHAALLREGYRRLTAGDWRTLLSLDFPDAAGLKTTAENVATPLSLVFLLALGYHYALNHHLAQKLEEARTSYREGRGAMIPIKHRLDTVGAHARVWEGFTRDTLVRPDALHGVGTILRVARDTNTTVKYVKSSGGKTETVVETPSATAFLKAVVATKRFENVKLEFSKTDPLRGIDNTKMIAHITPYDANATHEY